MGEFSIFHLGFLVFMFLPIIAWAVKAPKFNIASIISHFFRWYSIGFVSFIAMLFIGLCIQSIIPEKEKSQTEPVKIQSHLIQKHEIRKGLRI